MASPFQRQARLRKVIYGVLILVLFTATIAWRQFIAAKFDHLALREQDLGDVELTGSFVRRALVGSRGVVVCLLWKDAIEKQKRQEWNELELRINQITKLQPHFPSPWEFQADNLAYNVSAECDRVRDKYYYITRGIELMAEGERQNRKNPYLRYKVGLLYQHKFSITDQADTLRSYFQLSCIDPVERDPRRLRRPDGQIDLARFKEFCQANPQLVRRLRETQALGLRCRTPDDVVTFLTDKRVIQGQVVLEPLELPGRFEALGRDDDGFLKLRTTLSKWKLPEKQFPVFPGGEMKTPVDFSAKAGLPSHFDPYLAAYVWHVFAQEPPLPPPPGKPGPGDFDPRIHRVPSKPTLIIFRSYPALARSFFAEQLEKEGWFDEGWEIDRDRQPRDRWLPESLLNHRAPLSGLCASLGQGPMVLLPYLHMPPEELEVGVGLASQAWLKALEAQRKYGRENGLLLADNLEDNQRAYEALKERGRPYREAYQVKENQPERRLRAEDLPPEYRDSFEAHRQLLWYQQNRGQFSGPAHFAQAEVESTREAIVARKILFKAEQKRRAAESAQAIRLYEEAFPIWIMVLNHYAQFAHEPHGLQLPHQAQDESYRIQLRYLNLIIDRKGKEFKDLMHLEDTLARRRIRLRELCLVQDLLMQGAIRPPGATLWLPGPQPFVNLRPPGPFDGKDQWGEPLLHPQAIRNVRANLGYPD